MNVCQEFALWMDDQDERPDSSAEKLALLEAYLTELSESYFVATSIPPRAWSVFDGLVHMGGNCSPGDFAQFEFESMQAMRPHVKNLEEANLVTSSLDESDKRRKTIGVSPRGWFVQYHRSGYKL
jgi:DNA-binding MarR family transcriptional regulator